MPLLSNNNITAELSYAYLHAIAAKAGMSCKAGDRHDDGAGVDAEIRVKEDFGAASPLNSFTIDVQLKSTIQQPTLTNDLYSYALELKNYNELRDTTCSPLKLLVVLFLPADHTPMAGNLSRPTRCAAMCVLAWSSWCSRKHQQNETNCLHPNRKHFVTGQPENHCRNFF